MTHNPDPIDLRGMNRTRRIAVIENGASGAGEAGKLKQLLLSALGDNCRLLDCYTLSEGGDLCALTRQAIAGHADVVAAAGGDGTVSAVASQLVGTQTALGVIPLGTLNHFAKDLGIPLDPEAAVLNLLHGPAAWIDVGEVNGQIFLNNSALGLYPRMVERREQRQQRGSSKWAAMLWATLQILLHYPSVHLRLNIDGREIRRKTPFVFVGNNAYRMEGLNGGSRERLDGGQLTLYMARQTGRLGLMKLALKALSRRLFEAAEFDALSATDFVLETRRRWVSVATDGEVTKMRSPLRFRIRPRALRVIISTDGTNTDATSLLSQKALSD